MKRIVTPLTKHSIADLKAGEEVLLTGTVYTARDQAHLRMCKMLDKGETLPVDIKGQIIYYCGPTPAGGRTIGACGPTTSSRMDTFTEPFLKSGLSGMIGKGARSNEVRKAIERYRAIYFLAPGGAATYLSKKVRSCELAGFDDLGPEAIYKLYVEDFPLIVGIDSKGKDVYSS
ncbi:MAG: FumA C-terminus/TtdB family hydratase beta subunit [Candidatus Omnitrophica bacterium]|nr:FumA C-terminus/TtdB family hydratase beta subunit [Candidatus Omnitrophota bacterium]